MAEAVAEEAGAAMEEEEVAAVVPGAATQAAAVPGAATQEEAAPGVATEEEEVEEAAVAARAGAMPAAAAVTKATAGGVAAATAPGAVSGERARRSAHFTTRKAAADRATAANSCTRGRVGRAVAAVRKASAAAACNKQVQQAVCNKQVALGPRQVVRPGSPGSLGTRSLSLQILLQVYPLRECPWFQLLEGRGGTLGHPDGGGHPIKTLGSSRIEYQRFAANPSVCVHQAAASGQRPAAALAGSKQRRKARGRCRTRWRRLKG